MNESNNRRNTHVTLDQIRKDAKHYKADHPGTSLNDAQHFISRQFGYRNFLHAKAELEGAEFEGNEQRDQAIGAANPDATPSDDSHYPPGDLLYPQIPAGVYSDDGRRIARFDAAPWIAQASDEAIRRLLQDGFFNTPATHSVAEAAADYAPQISAVYEYVARLNHGEGEVSLPGFITADCGDCEERMVGVTVKILDDAVAHWLRAHRPSLLSDWPVRYREEGIPTEEEPDPLPLELMSFKTMQDEATGLADLIVTEDPTRPESGRWIWYRGPDRRATSLTMEDEMEDRPKQSEHSFSSEEEALRDALATLAYWLD